MMYGLSVMVRLILSDFLTVCTTSVPVVGSYMPRLCFFPEFHGYLIASAGIVLTPTPLPSGEGKSSHNILIYAPMPEAGGDVHQ